MATTWDEDYGFSDAVAGEPVVNRPSASFDPSDINPNAGSVDDLLKFGLARLIDAKTRPVKPENTAPVLAPADGTRPRLVSAGAIGGVPKQWLVLGGLAGVGLLIYLRSR